MHYSKVKYSQLQRRQSTLLHSDPPFSPSKSSALTISKFVFAPRKRTLKTKEEREEKSYKL